jgi:hypothetical protein
MFKAKLIITLALIGIIQHYYADDAEDVAKTIVPAVSCAAALAPTQATSGSDRDALSIQAASCAETELRVTASNG